MAELWEAWGMLAYAIAATWAFFEGETFVILASAAAEATGLIDPWLLLVCVWLGSFAGDQTWFFLGRRFGPAALRRIPHAQRHADRAAALLDRYGVLFVLSFRFLYGVRNVASAVCGIARMDRKRFAVLNFIAAGLWAASFTAAGWFLGRALGPERLVWLLAGVAVLAVSLILVRRLRSQRRIATVPSGAD
ncbi:MAG: DedA family protein [Proteobacteria bacterium]|nr:DedA family protein [Pseudomonadota bacterium]